MLLSQKFKTLKWWYRVSKWWTAASAIMWTALHLVVLVFYLPVVILKFVCF